SPTLARSQVPGDQGGEHGLTRSGTRVVSGGGERPRLRLFLHPFRRARERGVAEGRDRLWDTHLEGGGQLVMTDAPGGVGPVDLDAAVGGDPGTVAPLAQASDVPLVETRVFLSQLVEEVGDVDALGRAHV